MVFDSRICHRNGRSNNRVERAGSTPAAQPDRYAHRVGREGEGCNTWRREGVLADQGDSVWVGSGEARQASQTHPEILTSCRGRSRRWDRGPYSSQRRRSP